MIRAYRDRRSAQVRGLAASLSFLIASLWASGCRQFPETGLDSDLESQGRQILRDDTFGNEQFWTDTARLHEVVGRDIQPLEALDLGLKVDMDRLNLLKFLVHNPFSTGGRRNCSGRMPPSACAEHSMRMATSHASGSPRYGWNVGLGTKVYVLGFRSFLEARYHRTERGENDVHFFPVTFGVLF